MRITIKEGQIIQTFGKQEEWYLFVLEGGKVIKVWHDLRGVKDWQIGGFIKFVQADDYNQLAEEFVIDEGVLYTNYQTVNKIERKLQQKFGFADKELAKIVLEKWLVTLIKEILDQSPSIYHERQKIRDWLVKRGVGNYDECDSLSYDPHKFHTFNILKYEKKIKNQEQVKRVKEIRYLEEIISYRDSNTNSLVEKFLTNPYWNNSPYYSVDKDPTKIVHKFLEEVNSYISINNLHNYEEGTKHAFFNAVVKKITDKKKCCENNCNQRINLWEEFCEQHLKICAAPNCSQRISFFITYCSSKCTTHLCSASGCYEKITWDFSFCEMHNMICKENNCSLRTSRWERYCLEHRGTCQASFSHCPIRIPANTSYCAHHQIYHFCYEAPICQEEILVSETYCPLHKKQLDKRVEQKNLKSLVQQKLPALSNPQEVTTFTTWWNKNLATVVNYNSGYWVFLVVYDKEKTNNSNQINWTKEVFVFPSNHTTTKWSEHSHQQHSSLASAQSEASWLRGALNGNNPILYIHPEANSYCSFSDIIKEPYVIKRDLPRWTSEPSRYLKPLDIVKVKNEKFGDYFYHVGVYVGNGYVCQFTKDKKDTTIDPWSYFLEGGNGEIIRYHPIIPFKHYKKIIKQIAIAETTNFRKDNYEVANRNCEHLSNMLVYGINHSEQIQARRGDIIARNALRTTMTGILFAPFANEYSINNGKGETIKISNEISKTNEDLERFLSDAEIIERTRSTYSISLFTPFPGENISNILRESINEDKEKIKNKVREIEARIEISPYKSDCKIM